MDGQASGGPRPLPMAWSNRGGGSGAIFTQNWGEDDFPVEDFLPILSQPTSAPTEGSISSEKEADGDHGGIRTCGGVRTMLLGAVLGLLIRNNLLQAYCFCTCTATPV